MIPPLTAGIRRFRSHAWPSKRSLFEKLAKGQSPKVLLVTCSDSRIVPHLMTSAEPGDLFVIRNAGNIVPPYASSATGEEATVEYAVEALKVEHVVVCGHSGCGAMGGLIAPQGLTALPSVARWLELARPTLQRVEACCGATADPERRLRVAIEQNARQQLENLETHPSVAKALAQGTLSLHAWVYDIRSGEIREYDERLGEYRDVINFDGATADVARAGE